MEIHFWGVRGSYPCPGAATVRYGGNTSCIEVRTKSGQIIVLDCGTGACQLGKRLVADESAFVAEGSLLLTHTHWDHIQGFPFFAPLFSPKSKWNIYGPRGIGQSLQEVVTRQLQYEYSPVSLTKMAAQKRFTEVSEGTFEIGDVTVRTRFMNHPVLTLAYRLECDGASVVYVPDHEPHFDALAQGIRELKSEDLAHSEFVQGADLLIHDAQYLADEYENRRGWGHSTLEYTVDLAALSGVKQLALFHFDPDRDDAAIDAMVARANNRVAERHSSNLAVIAAAEGTFVQCASDEPKKEELDSDAVVNHHVVAVMETSDASKSLGEATKACGFRFHHIGTIQELVSELEQGQMRPSVVFVQSTTPGLCDHIVELEELSLQIPIVLVKSPGHMIECSSEMQHVVSDWIGWPFSQPYGQARITAWCIRAENRWRASRVSTNETERLAALDKIKSERGWEPEDCFDRLTKRACEIAGTPFAGITFIDDDKQYFKSLQGAEIRETPRELAYCAYTINGNEWKQIADGRDDPRFADSPQVQDYGICFYAGYPIKSRDGHNIGGFCVMDVQPRSLTNEQLAELQSLAEAAQAELWLPKPTPAIGSDQTSDQGTPVVT